MATKVVIGEVRMAYPHLFEPWKPEASEGAAKYGFTILIPKSATKIVEQVKNAIKEAYTDAVPSRWGNKKPAQWFNPLQDGDAPKKDGESRGEEFKGHWFINAKSSSRPGVVDARRQPILSDEEVYGGCYCYVSIAFAGYNNSGSFGISCFLNNVMKTRDGEHLGAGKTTAEEDFANVDVPFDAPASDGSDDIFG